MRTLSKIPDNAAQQSATKTAAVIKLSIGLSGVVFLLMMIFGLIMRAAQAGWVDLDNALFYQLLTAHGAGMVGTATFSGAAIMWYFLARHVALNATVYIAFLSLFLLGVVLVLGSIFIGGFGGAWSFLFPLPALSGGIWEVGAAVAFCLGYISIGVGFLLYYLEVGYKIARAYGGLLGGLGWRFVWHGDVSRAPPPTVIAAASVTVFNSIGIIFGAIVLVATIVNLLFPEFAIDALMAKNAILFFGHVFINASIYMAVTAVYEVIPEYTGKPWKVSRVFAIAWAVVVIFVQGVYFHHLLQDVNMPKWTMVVGQVMSYGSSVVLIAVTVYSTAVYLKGAAIKWDLSLRLLVLGVIGWGIGTIPAFIDGMVAVNKIMHNTMWVPGHFHTYLLLGEVAMAFGFAAWLVRGRAIRETSALDRFAFGA